MTSDISNRECGVHILRSQHERIPSCQGRHPNHIKRERIIPDCSHCKFVPRRDRKLTGPCKFASDDIKPVCLPNLETVGISERPVGQKVETSTGRYAARHDTRSKIVCTRQHDLVAVEQRDLKEECLKLSSSFLIKPYRSRAIRSNTPENLSKIENVLRWIDNWGSNLPVLSAAKNLSCIPLPFTFLCAIT